MPQQEAGWPAFQAGVVSDQAVHFLQKRAERPEMQQIHQAQQQRQARTGENRG